MYIQSCYSPKIQPTFVEPEDAKNTMKLHSMTCHWYITHTIMGLVYFPIFTVEMIQKVGKTIPVPLIVYKVLTPYPPWCFQPHRYLELPAMASLAFSSGRSVRRRSKRMEITMKLFLFSGKLTGRNGKCNHVSFRRYIDSNGGYSQPAMLVFSRSVDRYFCWQVWCFFFGASYKNASIQKPPQKGEKDFLKRASTSGRFGSPVASVAGVSVVICESLKRCSQKGNH